MSFHSTIFLTIKGSKDLAYRKAINVLYYLHEDLSCYFFSSSESKEEIWRNLMDRDGTSHDIY